MQIEFFREGVYHSKSVPNDSSVDDVAKVIYNTSRKEISQIPNDEQQFWKERALGAMRSAKAPQCSGE